jgi:hypothetical protein
MCIQILTMIAPLMGLIVIPLERGLTVIAPLRGLMGATLRISFDRGALDDDRSHGGFDHDPDRSGIDSVDSDRALEGLDGSGIGDSFDEGAHERLTLVLPMRGLAVWTGALCREHLSNQIFCLCVGIGPRLHLALP